MYQQTIKEMALHSAVKFKKTWALWSMPMFMYNLLGDEIYVKMYVKYNHFLALHLRNEQPSENTGVQRHWQPENRNIQPTHLRSINLYLSPIKVLSPVL
jgi:hypothetical protein